MRLLMPIFYSVFLFVLFNHYRSVNSNSQILGPYYANMKSFGHCRANGRNDWQLVQKLTRLNSTHYKYFLNVTLDTDAGNNILINMHIASRGANGWTPWIDVKDGYCVFVDKYAKEFVADFWSTASGKPWICPIKKGFYRLSYIYPQKWLTPFDKFPVFPYGSYRMELSFSRRNDEKIGQLDKILCLQIFVDVEPISTQKYTG